MERRLKKAVELVSAFCILSVLLTMLSFSGHNLFKPSESTMLSGSEKSYIRYGDYLSGGKVTKARIRNQARYSLNHSASVVTAPIVLEKQVHRKPAPKHTFQWLYHESVLVYSAHYDHMTNLVKIVGFKHRMSNMSDLGVKCLYPDGSSEPMQFLYNVSVITPRPGLLYNTFIWKCKWRKGVPPPSSMTLDKESGESLLNMSVTYHTWPEGPEKVKQPLLCVKPIVKSYGDSYQLREFIEMSRLMGAGKVVLYPQSINESLIRSILDEYQDSGFVDVHEWKPPVAMESLHAFGQKSHNQHCLYTYKYRYQWAAFIDLDELLVADTALGLYEDMIQNAIRSINDDVFRDRIAGFTVRSQMCIVSLDDDPIYRSAGGKSLCKLTSLRKTNCTQPMRPGVWSKPLANTDYTEVVDIHKIRLAYPGYHVLNLGADIATVHHYRALSHNSMVLAQSKSNNVIKRNTQVYNDKIHEILPELCRLNNPLIGDKLFTDKLIF